MYNLEVDGEHVFHVTAGGVLVHNSCGDIVYHGTDADSAENIMTYGLNRDSEIDAGGDFTLIDDKGFSVTTERDIAEEWAIYRAALRGKGPAVIEAPTEALPLTSTGYNDPHELYVPTEDYPKAGPDVFRPTE